MNRYIPPVTKNLLILNTIFFIGKYLLGMYGVDLDVIFGAFFPLSPNFHWYQVLSHMFMHAGLTHFFFNMFTLWMFGSAVEQALGAKKFLILYFVCGLGAFALFNLVNYFEFKQVYDSLVEANVPLNEVSKYSKLNFTSNNNIQEMGNQWLNTLPKNTDYAQASKFYLDLVVPMMGASGAIYGVLVAFGLMFPNTVLVLLFPPIPLKAKFFIPLMILFELYLGINQVQGDNIAHFAHLGGAVFGFFLTKHWIKNRYRWN
ncbi:rhomboid family intramembrane serine protease [Apibacter sp. HY039]|uniref:rhomboid family intramembrane serine protease n=1 Tax=Apibacter sp. HY039 TaxID=2501476 RepID=UPI000FEBD98D|nr:rhomboid family intramembrane serine protease [Apibacter sp. HY039]